MTNLFLSRKIQEHAKDILDENSHKEKSELQSEPKSELYTKEIKRPKRKTLNTSGCYIGGIYFKNQKKAAKHLGVNYSTFKDWLNGRRNPKMKNKLNLRYAKN